MRECLKIPEFIDINWPIRASLSWYFCRNFLPRAPVSYLQMLRLFRLSTVTRRLAVFCLEKPSSFAAWCSILFYPVLSPSFRLYYIPPLPFHCVLFQQARSLSPASVDAARRRHLLRRLGSARSLARARPNLARSVETWSKIRDEDGLLTTQSSRCSIALARANKLHKLVTCFLIRVTSNNICNSNKNINNNIIISNNNEGSVERGCIALSQY